MITQPYTVAAIVLAAGTSSRMGKRNKLLEKLDGVPILHTVLNSVIASDIGDCIVVTGFEAVRIKDSISDFNARIAFNPDYDSGLSSSLKTGILALRQEIDAVLIVLGDMPDVNTALINHIIESFDPLQRKDICVPVYKGIRGNPVLWPNSLFAELCTITGDIGGRHLINKYRDRVYHCEMSDNSIHNDIDSLEQLESRNKSRQFFKRVEDYQFLTGKGQYTDDFSPAGATYAVFVRSPHAHATILNIDTSEAKLAPGVIDIFTAVDLKNDNVEHVPCLGPVTGINGSESISPPNPLLADGKVYFVGDPVVLVIGKTLNATSEAAELIQIKYEELEAVDQTARALNPEAVQIWPEAPHNLGVDWEIGDSDAVATAFEQATHKIELTVTNNRIAVSPIEPRAAVGTYDSQTECMTLTTPCQGVHGVRSQIAEYVFKLPLDKVHIVTPDVGGAFGARFYSNREQICVLWAARKINQTVRWTATRRECFISDGQGRDHINRGELALDADGRFLGLRVSTIANMGSHMKDWGPAIPCDISNEVLTGPYRIPAAHANVKCVFTNTVPIDAYRGTGRAEAIYLLERLVDAAARELSMSPDEIRRRNLLQRSDLPYTTVSGQVYDSGDNIANMGSAMEKSDWAGINHRKQEGLANGKLIGIGMSTWIMSAAGLMDEQARLKLDTDGGISAFVGTQPAGQGHATAYTQIISELFDIDASKVRIYQGDSESCPTGSGTGQSRSLLMGGLAIKGAAKALIEKIEQQSAADADNSDSMPLEASYNAEQAPMTFPQGCHICELSVDRDTGRVEIIRYTTVDDFGKLVNPQMCEGQVHGGVVQGIGQALLEQIVYQQGGQLKTGNLVDYCLPRADDIPMLDVNLVEDAPCLTNSMGVKGSGESGAVAAPPAVMNALIDALAPVGVNHIDMPATSEKVWKAINQKTN